MEEGTVKLTHDPAYLAGLLDATGRVRFAVTENDGMYWVRPMLRFKPHSNNERYLLLGDFLDSQDYKLDFMDRERGSSFFALQRWSDLEDLCEFIAGQSAHLIWELQFVTGVFAEEFAGRPLTPQEYYRFLRTRDELRFDWHPRGRNHIRPSDIEAQLEASPSEISTPRLPSVAVREDYSIEWIAGVFDGLCRYRPSIAESSDYSTGYAMYPIARLTRSGLHSSFVTHILRFCDDYSLRFANSSGDHHLNISFTGSNSIHRLIDIILPRMHVLAPHSRQMKRDILPRFGRGDHRTRQGFYETLCEFDPIAIDSGGPFRGRTFSPEYFADLWRDELSSGEASSKKEPEVVSGGVQKFSELQPVTLTPDEYAEVVGRYQSIVDRQLRDTVSVKELKARYQNECQLCGVKLNRGDGIGYSEVHHIWPIGRPHNGPDILENMVVLCPNHHADFDNGVLVIDPEDMTVHHPYDSTVDTTKLEFVGDHQVARESLEYHNGNLAVVNRDGDTGSGGV